MASARELNSPGRAHGLPVRDAVSCGRDRARTSQILEVSGCERAGARTLLDSVGQRSKTPRSVAQSGAARPGCARLGNSSNLGEDVEALAEDVGVIGDGLVGEG